MDGKARKPEETAKELGKLRKLGSQSGQLKSSLLFYQVGSQEPFREEVTRA